MSDGAKFAIVPRFIWQGCQPTEIKVYCALASYADWDTGVCWPSRQTIADVAGVSLSTVKRSLGKLEAMGAIQINHRREDGTDMHATNLYVLPFAINRPGGVTDDPTWGHRWTGGGVTRDPQTITKERKGLTQPKNDPRRCPHLPVDDDGYCTACGNQIGDNE